MDDPKKYDDINDWAKTLTKEDAEKIYHDLNAGFNTAAAKKRAEEIRAKIEAEAGAGAEVEAELREKEDGDPQTSDQTGSDNIQEISAMNCPKCGSSNIAKIQYGMPAFTEELQADLDSGKVVLGGCVVDGTNPEFHCNDCGAEF